ncbi:MAG: outer membrane beta-barrel protein [Rubrivivax sp.]
MLHKHTRPFIALAAGLLLAGAAQAQNLPGPFFGIGGGVSSYDMDCSGTSRCDSSGAALRVSGGWRSAINLGFEAVYTNFGQASATVFSPGYGNVDVALKSYMLGAGAVYFLPLGQNVELAFRLGAAHVEAKPNGRIGSTSVDLGSEKRLSAYVGFGAGFKIAPNLLAEINVDSTRFEAAGDEANVSAVTVGLRWRF